MSMLAPLYLLGGLAIALPIIFHLIRRQPQGQMPFSSLMFLTPTPPRLSRRSRLDHWLLLLLRGLALLLLAIAFARPYYRSHTDTQAQQPGRRIGILLDTSASMMREDLWSQAKQKIGTVLKQLDPEDQVSLFAFDESFRTVMAPNETKATSLSDQTRQILTELEHLHPTYHATDLGKALTAVADALTQSNESDEPDNRAAQVILITDLQEGAEIARLQAYQWPEQTFLEVHTVACKNPSNAHLVLMPEEIDSSEEDSGNLSVRIVNSPDASNADFDIGYLKANGQMDAVSMQSVHVPPGTSRLVSMVPPPAEDAVQTIALTGDDQSFDNQRFFMTRAPKVRTLINIGTQDPDPTKSLGYFLSKANLSSTQQTVKLQSVGNEEPLPTLDPRQTPLVVMEPSPKHVDALKLYLSQGGRGLLVLGKSRTVQAQSDFLRALTGIEEIEIDEAMVSDYSMLGWIDFKHFLFAPFVDPQFNDFTKVRFWSHREVKFPNDSPKARTIAKFDDGSPAFIEFTLDQGTLWVCTAGWHPEESQWALSSKFVPILATMFDPKFGAPDSSRGYVVGDTLALPRGTKLTHRTIDGLSQTAISDTAPVTLDVAGTYHIESVEKTWDIGVNLSHQESRTQPISVDVLEEFGVTLGRAPSAAERELSQRQMRDLELENRQRFWKWIAIGVLSLLAIESLLGWRFARGSATPSASATVS